jgi:Phage tail assembly chaperone protein
MADFDFAGYTHDHMAMAIADMFPAITNPADFTTAHSIDPKTGLQTGDPFIFAWKNKSIPQPKDADVHAHFHANSDALRAKWIRSLRNEALAKTDHKGTAPADAPDGHTSNVDDWKTYRQALRDIPQQPGFPANIVWPTRPKG